jgi:hypothetical protein
MISKDKVAAKLAELINRNRATASIDNGAITIQINGQSLAFSSDNNTVRSSINRY